jgi:hypothetical protein
MKAYNGGGEIHAFLTTSCTVVFIQVISFSFTGEVLLPKLCVQLTTMRLAGHVAHMVEKRNEYRVWRALQERDHLEGLGIDG